MRKDFPVFARDYDGQSICYLDSAASALTHQLAIDKLNHYYTQQSCNVHRGIYRASEEATSGYEQARSSTADWLGCSSEEVIFTSGTTAGINLAARSILRGMQKRGEKIEGRIVWITELDHHASYVTWHMLAEEYGLDLRCLKVSDDGVLDLAPFQASLSEKPLVMCFPWASNTLGSVQDAAKICGLCREHGVLSFVDAAQWLPHGTADTQKLACDALFFSTHKLFGPTGLGVVYATSDLQQKMEPIVGGGDMIRSVAWQDIQFADGPQRFEAGTPPISGVLSWGGALEFLLALDVKACIEHEQKLTGALQEMLRGQKDIRVLGPQEGRVSLCSFVIEGIHPHDLAQLLDQKAIAVRAGHHCTQPLHTRFGVRATTRASLSLYSDTDDIERLKDGLAYARRMLL
jgi:cysteine desulfurase/selenocysteine lyase